MSRADTEIVTIYPFHQRLPGMPDLFHVRCDHHLDFGFCGPYDEADTARLEHLASHDREVRP